MQTFHESRAALESEMLSDAASNVNGKCQKSTEFIAEQLQSKAQ